MKFTCLQENLIKGLNTVSKAVPVKSSLPILANILITAEEGRLKLSATNLETAIVTYVGASTEKEGSTTVPARLIKDFIANLSPSTITGELKEDILHLTSEKTKSKLNGINPTDYPTLPEVPDNAKILELDPKAFSNAISMVYFAASTDDSRPVFTGIFLKYENGLLTLAASDGFRLSEKTMGVKGDVDAFSTIIPAKTLLEVSRVFANSAEPIKFVLNPSENLALFESEETLIATRILDGQYPDYKRIIPEKSVITAEFSASELLEAVKLSNVFSKENTTPIKMQLNDSGTINILSVSQEIGEHQSEVSAIIEGEPLEIAFNSRYFLDLLNNLKSNRMVLTANNKVSPCLLKNPDDETFIHIIMPMQIQG